MTDERTHGAESAINDTEESPPEIKYLDPLALATITTGTMLIADGFAKVGEAASWLVGYPVFTHEFIDPIISKQMGDAALAQYPDLPIDPPVDFMTLSKDLRERYGETVPVKRGENTRDKGPMTTFIGLGVAKDKVAVVYPDDGSMVAPVIGTFESSDD